MATSAPIPAHLSRLIARYPVLAACQEDLLTAFSALCSCYRQGHKLLLCGNGGSCADCDHIAGELLKGFYLKRPLPQKEKAALGALLEGHENELQCGLPAISLCAHAALISAFANDVDASLCYAQQVIALGQPGDILLGISTSGNAKNVLWALKAAKARGLYTIGLSGQSGGQMKALCDCTLCAPATVTADIQELHLPMYHALCAMLEEEFFRDGE